MSRRIHLLGRSGFEQPMRAHRRQHIHGALRPMVQPRRLTPLTTLLGAGVAIFCLLYFSGQMLRPYL